MPGTSAKFFFFFFFSRRNPSLISNRACRTASTPAYHPKSICADRRAVMKPLTTTLCEEVRESSTFINFSGDVLPMAGGLLYAFQLPQVSCPLPSHLSFSLRICVDCFFCFFSTLTFLIALECQFTLRHAEGVLHIPISPSFA